MSFLCYSTKYRWRGLGARIKPDRPVASIVKPLGDSDGKECQAETLKGGGRDQQRGGQARSKQIHMQTPDFKMAQSQVGSGLRVTPCIFSFLFDARRKRGRFVRLPINSLPFCMPVASVGNVFLVHRFSCKKEKKKPSGHTGCTGEIRGTIGDKGIGR